jgi:hypothetical protein
MCRGFLKLHRDLLEAGFSLVEAGVYGYVETFEQRGQPCFASDEAIGEALNVDRKTVFRARKKLEERGALICLKMGKKRCLKTALLEALAACG